MSKTALGKMFLLVFGLSFVMLFFVTASFSYSVYPESWYVELVTRQFFYIPVFLYLVILAGVIAGCISLYTYLILRKQNKRLMDLVEELADGNYQAEVFNQSFQMEGYNSSVLNTLEKTIYLIREKLVDLSLEVQKNSNLPHYVDGETKEEILEQERHRLARELHDSVSQQLFAAMMLLSTLNQQMDNADEVTRKQMNMIEKIINDAQSEMRALLLHLRPVNLEGKSIKQGIEQLLKELSTKIQIQLSWSIADVFMSKGIEDHLFRIVQELLSNTLRHAKASELEVYMDKVDNTLTLRVIDDGVGFDSNIKTAGSYGLQNINERVAGMGGTCKIISFAGEGTSIEIKIPVIGGSE